MVMNLKGKVALVTGSAGGIGKHILLRLSDEGCKVVINYRDNEESARRLLSELEQGGKKALVFKADVTEPEQVKSMFKFVSDHWNGVDILVNNVGDFIMMGNLDYSTVEWKYMIESNLNSAYYCCKEAAPYMIKQKYGRIVNIGMASADRIHSVSSTLPYTIAKTGIIILTRSIAKDLAVHNITANAVSPGIIDNENLSDEMKTKAEKFVPSKKIGTPEDIARAVLFLVSPESDYINGANIIVSGGWEV